MCGIAGHINYHVSPKTLGRISSLLSHRGPEDAGLWETAGDRWSAALIHRRLKVIDLSDAGRQPMQRGPLTVVFNGEIYNFLDLRSTLEKDGIEFSSASDTEVILAAYARWGVGAIERFYGMFAFALWDDQRKELILGRDRLGKKPLFYRSDGQSFVFGSEIKTILAVLNRAPDLDYESLDDYLTYLYIPYPKTIFRDIYQLPPATWMRVRVHEGGLKTETHNYWDPLKARLQLSGSPKDLADRLKELIAETVSCRLLAHVPLGVLLSGGLDSSTITAFMARSSASTVRSFSVGFEQAQAYDETPFARVVADHFQCHHESLRAEPNSSQHLAKIIWHFDQPFGNPTAVLTYILSELTKRYVTVALSGDGGDELFGGYPRYIGAYVSRVPRALPSFIRNRMMPVVGDWMSDDFTGRHQFRRIREFMEGAGQPLIEMYLNWVTYFSQETKANLYTPDSIRRLNGHDARRFVRGLFQESEQLEPLNRLAYVDLKSFLCCNVLEYEDRMSMAHALELRAPLTDHRLVEFALRMPFSLKFRFGESKWLLKQSMKPFLPPHTLSRRKLGFNPPVGLWLKGELRNLPRLLLSDEVIGGRGIFRPEGVRRLLEGHAACRRDHSLHIWALMMLEIWCRIYLDGQSSDQVQDSINDVIEAKQRVHPSCI